MMLKAPQMMEALSGLNGRLSSKRVLANRVCWAFIGGFAAVTTAICYRIAHSPTAPIGWEIVGVYTAITVPLAAFGGVIYSKKDVPDDPGK